MFPENTSLNKSTPKQTDHTTPAIQRSGIAWTYTNSRQSTCVDKLPRRHLKKGKKEKERKRKKRKGRGRCHGHYLSQSTQLALSRFSPPDLL